MSLFVSSKGKFLLVLASRILPMALGIMLVPSYIGILGVESYGLVAFYATLSGALTILDLGLSTAINRQLSIYRASTDHENALKLFYSVELVYWAIAILGALLIIGFSDIIATRWLNATNLSPAIIRRTICIMGMVFACQFPSSIYEGTLMAYEKQHQNAVLNMVCSLLKSIGVLVVIVYISATVQAYFFWQLAISIVLTGAQRLFVKRNLIGVTRSRYSLTGLKVIRVFATGITTISLLTFFLAQIDKILVSKMMKLEEVTYYSLAFTLASLITQLISPFQPIFFPKFAALVAQDRRDDVIDLYHRSSRWLAITVFPVGFLLVFFPYEVLFFWTKNSELARTTAPLLRLFSVGSMANALMWIPYFVLLAKGITRFTFIQNSICAIITVPLLVVFLNKFGITGASSVWMITNIGCLLISLPIFFKKYLKQKIGPWMFNLSGPLFVAVIVFGLAKIISSHIHFNIASFIATIGSAATLYVLCVKDSRTLLKEWISKLLV